MTTNRPQKAQRTAVIVAVVMIAQQVAAKTTRDALFLTSFEARELLLAMIGTAVLSTLVAILIARGMKRWGPARLAPVIFAVHAALFLTEWLLSDVREELVSILVYLHVGSLGAIAISGFWSVVNETFDPYSAKKAIAIIGGGGTVGGVAGGVMAERISSLWGVEAMLPVLAALNAFCAGFVLILGGRQFDHSGPPSAERFRDTLRSLSRTPFLQKIAGLVVLVGISSSILDFTVKAEADATFSSPEQLSQFFAVFYTATSVLTFAVQAGFGARVLRSLGLSGTIALLPLGVLVSSVLGASVQKLWSAVLAAGLENVLRRSLYRSGYELLYTPMAPERKRPAKTLIDVAFDRAGDLLGAGILLTILALFPLHADLLALAFCGAVAALTLLVALHLHKDYVNELVTSLQMGVVQLSQAEAVDATTMRTLASTATAINRDELLRQIELLRGLPDAEGDLAETPPPVRSHEALQQATVLAGGDRAEIAKILERTDLVATVAPFVIPMIADAHLENVAASALRRLAPNIVGQLGDVCLDENQPARLRARILRVLGECLSDRSRDILVRALSSRQFDVRYHAGQALLELVKNTPELQPDVAQLGPLVLKELRRDSSEWDQSKASDGVAPPELVDQRTHDGISHGLEHVFSLLALCFERDALELCLRAIFNKNRQSHGTALEYLHNILSTEVYKALKPRLYSGTERTSSLPSSPATREKSQILADLQRTMTR